MPGFAAAGTTASDKVDDLNIFYYEKSDALILGICMRLFLIYRFQDRGAGVGHKAIWYFYSP